VDLKHSTYNSTYNSTYLSTNTTGYFPGPKGNPIIGSAFEIQADMLLFFDKCEKEYGPCFQYSAGPTTLLALGDPQLIRTICLERIKDFPRAKAHNIPRLFLGNGIITNDGEAWKRSRLAFNASFSKEAIKNVYSLMINRIDDTVNSWIKTQGDEKDLHDEMMSLTLNIICDVIFGGALSDDISKVIRDESTHMTDFLVQRFYEVLQLPLYVPTPKNIKFNASKARLDRAINTILSERMNEKSPYFEKSPFFKALLPLSKDKNAPASLPRDEIVSFLFAGHETSANALMWTLMVLLESPELRNKLVMEIQSFVTTGPIGATGTLPSLEDLQKLPLLNATIKESLRLFPPAWGIVRECAETTTLGGHKVKKGTLVQGLPYIAHRSSRYWKDPLKFMPERFFGEDANNTAYLPFIMGSHVCIGQNLALAEITATIFMILSRLKFETSEKVDFKAEAFFTLKPKNPPKIKFIANHLE
jgi:cytochrome P450